MQKYGETLYPAQDLHMTVQLIVVGLSVPTRFGRLHRLDCEWLLSFLTNSNSLRCTLENSIGCGGGKCRVIQPFGETFRAIVFLMLEEISQSVRYSEFGCIIKQMYMYKSHE